jgi:hypothetical protein
MIRKFSSKKPSLPARDASGYPMVFYGSTK